MKKKITWKKIVLTIFLLTVLLILSIRLNNTFNKGANQQEVALGETLQVGHLYYTVTNIEITDKVVMDGVERKITDDNGVFLFIELTIDNKYFFKDRIVPARTISLFTGSEYFPSNYELSDYFAEEQGKKVLDLDPVKRRSSMDTLVGFVISEEVLYQEETAIHVTGGFDLTGTIQLNLKKGEPIELP